MVITTIAPITLPHRLSPLCINHILGSLEAPPKALERVVVVVLSRCGATESVKDTRKRIPSRRAQPHLTNLSLFIQSISFSYIPILRCVVLS